MGPSWWSTLFYKKPTDATEVTDSVGGYKPAQPSQKYPFLPIQPPRVDNKNQPWYGGERWWGRGPDTVQYKDAVTIDSTGQANYKLADVWTSLAGFFGGDNAKQNLMSKQNIPETQSSTKLKPIPMQMGRLNMSDQSGNVAPWSVNDTY